MIAFFAALLLAAVVTPTGIGGGVAYVPVFHFLGHPMQTEAMPMSFMLVLTGAASASFNYLRARLVDARLLPFLAVGAITGAPLGVTLTRAVPRGPVLVMFLVLLIYNIYRIQRQIHDGRTEEAQTSTSRRMSQMGAAFIGLAAGVYGGFLGLGGGLIIVPGLIWLGADGRVAAGTSMATIVFTSAAGVAAHLHHGAVPLETLAWPVAGALLGAQLGSRVMIRYLTPTHMQWVVSVILTLVTVRLVFSLI